MLFYYFLFHSSVVLLYGSFDCLPCGCCYYIWVLFSGWNMLASLMIKAFLNIYFLPRLTRSLIVGVSGLPLCFCLIWEICVSPVVQIEAASSSHAQLTLSLNSTREKLHLFALTIGWHQIGWKNIFSWEMHKRAKRCEVVLQLIRKRKLYICNSWSYGPDEQLCFNRVVLKWTCLGFVFQRKLYIKTYMNFKVQMYIWSPSAVVVLTTLLKVYPLSKHSCWVCCGSKHTLILPTDKSRLWCESLMTGAVVLLSAWAQQELIVLSSCKL